MPGDAVHKIYPLANTKVQNKHYFHIKFGEACLSKIFL